MAVVRRSLVWALALSLALHVLVLGYMLWIRPNRPASVAPEPVADAVAAAAEAIQPTIDDIRSRLDAERLYAARRTVEAQFEELGQRTAELSKIDPASLGKLTQTLEAAMGIKPADRAFEPRPDATGVFDFNTASLYDIEKVQTDDGTDAYERILVDAAGRTLRQRVSPDEFTQDDHNAFHVFQMARENPSLRPLVDLVRRYAEQEMEP